MAGFFTQIKKETAGASAPGTPKLDNAALAYGSVDKAAEAGSNKGHWLVYSVSTGDQVTKRRLNDPNVQAAAIKGELYSMYPNDLPNPGFVPLNSVPGNKHRLTVRPLKHNFASQENAYRDAFIEAMEIVSNDPVFGPALAKAVDQLNITVNA